VHRVHYDEVPDTVPAAGFTGFCHRVPHNLRRVPANAVNVVIGTLWGNPVLELRELGDRNSVAGTPLSNFVHLVTGTLFREPRVRTS
jgi:hypothetical protein